VARKTKPLPHETDTLDELETWGERAGDWLSANAKRVFAGAMVCLAVAGGYGAWASRERSREEAASAALERVRQAYMAAMGAPVLALETPDLANPEAARAIRAEYTGLFHEVAEQHAGTVAGTLARLEEAQLLGEQGDADAALAMLQGMLPDVAGSPDLEGLVLQRIAQIHEDAGRWQEAAEAHAQAGEIASYPLRYWAMASAAWCFSEAGDDERARALVAQVDAAAPDLPLPDHFRTRFRELRSGA